MLLVLGIIAWIVVPILAQQLQVLVKNGPQYITTVQEKLTGWLKVIPGMEQPDAGGAAAAGADAKDGKDAQRSLQTRSHKAGLQVCLRELCVCRSGCGRCPRIRAIGTAVLIRAITCTKRG